MFHCNWEPTARSSPRPVEMTSSGYTTHAKVSPVIQLTKLHLFLEFIAYWLILLFSTGVKGKIVLVRSHFHLPIRCSLLQVVVMALNCSISDRTHSGTWKLIYFGIWELIYVTITSLFLYLKMRPFPSPFGTTRFDRRGSRLFCREFQQFPVVYDVPTEQQMGKRKDPIFGTPLLFLRKLAKALLRRTRGRTCHFSRIDRLQIVHLVVAWKPRTWPRRWPVPRRVEKTQGINSFRQLQPPLWPLPVGTKLSSCWRQSHPQE